MKMLHSGMCMVNSVDWLYFEWIWAFLVPAE